MYFSVPKYLYPSSSYIIAMKKRADIRLAGYEMVEKLVRKSGTSGRVYVPVDWIGKRVKIILLEK